MSDINNFIHTLSIPDSIIEKWQRLVNTVAELMEVPTALIMKYEYPYLLTIVTSQNQENKVDPSYREKIFGTYCEKTIKIRETHEVENAYNHSVFKNKPNLEKNGFISYLGFPLEWPTGDVFGTICVLDVKEHQFSKKQKEKVKLFREIKTSVDAHLELIYYNNLLREAQRKIKKQKDEIKQQRDDFKLLTSTIRHDLSNDLMVVRGYLDNYTNKENNMIDYEEKALQVLEHSMKTIKQIHQLERLVETNPKVPLTVMDPIPHLEDIKENFEGLIEVSGSCKVEADKFLDLLLNELIRNAFKHTNTPKVEIHLQKNPTQNIIAIQDHGPGLPDTILTSYFDGTNGYNKLTGLTIANKIMKRYNGRIEYEKNEMGTLIKLVFPKHNNDI